MDEREELLKEIRTLLKQLTDEQITEVIQKVKGDKSPGTGKL